VTSLYNRPNFTAKQDVATHVDLALGSFLLGHTLYLWRGLCIVNRGVKKMTVTVMGKLHKMGNKS